MVWQLSPIQPAPLPPAPVPPPAPRETDESLFDRLRAAMNAGQVSLRLDFKRLRQGDSPVANQADGNVWFIASGAAVALAWLATGKLTHIPGWMVGGPVLLAAIALHFKVARPYVSRRIEKRVYDTGIKDIANWRKLWRFGGVAVVRTDGSAPAECVAPDGNWFEFARRLPPPAAAAGGAPKP
jgi:hypothetical protein